MEEQQRGALPRFSVADGMSVHLYNSQFDVAHDINVSSRSAA